MAERIRAFDGCSTSLGTPERWPTSLRTTVAMRLRTRHPVFTFWGPELLCLYNDAYSRSLGLEKHPHILGMPGRQAVDDDPEGDELRDAIGRRGLLLRKPFDVDAVELPSTARSAEEAEANASSIPVRRRAIGLDEGHSTCDRWRPRGLLARAARPCWSNSMPRAWRGVR